MHLRLKLIEMFYAEVLVMTEDRKLEQNVNEDRDVTEHMIDVEEYLELDPLYNAPLLRKRGKRQRP